MAFSMYAPTPDFWPMNSKHPWVFTQNNSVYTMNSKHPWVFTQNNSVYTMNSKHPWVFTQNNSVYTVVSSIRTFGPTPQVANSAAHMYVQASKLRDVKDKCLLVSGVYSEQFSLYYEF